MQQIKSFLGTGWAFPPAFDEDRKSLQLVWDEEDIRQSLFILFSTTPGERVTHLEYGCDLQRMVFQPITETNKGIMKHIIKTAILFYEPRIDVEEINIDTREEIEGVVYIEVIYTIRKINIRSNIVYPFYKIEGTSITDAALV
ncbi:MAG: hypothetical protein RLZZ292_1028 [Bacteroidota bacterium]|jgi:phage baseplate assembly protein W